MFGKFILPCIAAMFRLVAARANRLANWSVRLWFETQLAVALRVEFYVCGGHHGADLLLLPNHCSSPVFSVHAFPARRLVSETRSFSLIKLFLCQISILPARSKHEC
ncbi:uncharacterized protein LOC109725144 [Ananas comosus]|uniref:Uncharacterized protein LOC109725144 n=1 Tax=Ananas comosus TaxID=4615 RepID=A0A6P5GVE3_ANACO|nr:uncharacterized protein LOC109725144 [Ananas comosus]